MLFISLFFHKNTCYYILIHNKNLFRKIISDILINLSVSFWFLLVIHILNVENWSKVKMPEIKPEELSKAPITSEFAINKS